MVFLNSPEVSIGLSACVNTIHLLWLYTSRPYASEFINCIEIIGETVIVVINFSLLNFIANDDENKDLGIGLIFIALFAIL